VKHYRYKDCYERSGAYYGNVDEGVGQGELRNTLRHGCSNEGLKIQTLVDNYKTRCNTEKVWQ